MQIVETTSPLPPRLLAALAIDHSFTADFGVVADPAPGERNSVRVHLGSTHDIWLIRWGAGSRTELHDHGGSAGALFVVTGQLVEHRPHPTGVGRPIRRDLRELDHHAMPPSHVHEIANESTTTSASIHVYSPPLTAMQHYELTGASHLQVIRQEVVRVGTLGADEQAARR